MAKRQDQRGPVLVIAGPTASGKSALALAVAEEFAGVVINGDSMQVYRDLRILTARPTPEEEARAPHRLYGELDAEESCSAGRWRDMALAEIEAAHAAARLPIVVGGTGFYLRALEHGLAEIPEIPAEVRTAARRRHADIGGARMHAELAARDPQTAVRLATGDSQRLIRAWEVLEATGRPLSDWQREAAAAPAPYRFLRFVLEPPRQALYAACDRRLGRMVEQGALEEVAALIGRGVDPAAPVMKAVGVPQLAAHLKGECDLESALAAAQQATRRYAKRQLTWLRTQFPRDDLSTFVIKAQFYERMKPNIFKIIREFLLTA
ncbi:MAG: tRNA (adenosine(37)-N6)-dimethylallyltransferase MiaA [Rhodovibrionaceae bacterium]|nr:tRNA (adenosine(37)-N6)-dimethylallyltransferase MiaA [Rhodovibrionaceae bacterium]